MGPATQREVIHVAFGNSSCHLSAHLLNLQGLAATTKSSTTIDDEYGDDHDDDKDQRCYPLCNPHVTHTYSSSRSGTRASWVPRALLVDVDHDDGGDGYGERGDTCTSDAVLDAIRSDGGSLVYHGKSPSSIETLSRHQLSDPFRTMMEGDHGGENVDDGHHHYYHHRTTSLPSTHLPTPNSDLQSKRRKPPTTETRGSSSSPFEQRRRPWDETASAAVPFLHDARYMTSSSSPAMSELLHHRRHHLSHPSDQQKSLGPQQPRHVDWDHELADEQEPDSDDEDHDDDAARARQRKQFQMHQQRVLQEQQRLHHDQLQEMWNQALEPSSLSATDDALATDTPVNRRAPSWKDFYRMAPYAPSSILSAPVNDSTASLLREEVEDRFRALLEGCDSCQGMVHVASSPSSSDSSSASSLAIEAQQLLEFHKEECNSGRRFSIFMNSTQAGLSPQQVARHHVIKGCHWSHLVENSTAVLPIQDWDSSSSNAASATAAAMLLASALEAVTLPYRAHPEASTSKYRHTYGTGLAINSVDGYNDDAHLPMSMASFLAALTPSPAHTVLELDSYTPLDKVLAKGEARDASTAVESSAVDMATPIKSWSSQLLQGTVVERRILSSSGRGESRRSLDVHPPGSWLQQKSSHGGLVTLWSPRGSAAASAAQGSDDDRSRHQHFALLTSLRTGTTTSSPHACRTAINEPSSATFQLESVDDYLTCLMQGMGIRYRPEQSMANVVTRQSLNQLVDGSAVGTYWKAMMKTRTSGTATAAAVPAAVNDAPVLAVLGNSTRSYAFLSEVSAQMKEVVVAPRRIAAASGGSTSFTSVRNGWYRRDAALGLVPEEDDCLEALSQCLDIRDRYRPPHPAQDDEDVDGEDF